ncbi:hypothetical protein [Sulfobacillus thermosulfidooxidans]|uniref:hypothetical protein n=1 Tax=Sulfobacillus thermosulfidooxidans TaxID=28034 RepID=UPI000ABA07B0|nr:hypothetical protein [Sulfobacillus thermosulfidooxidans]
MVRFTRFGGGVVGLSLILSGCGSPFSSPAHPATQTPPATQAPPVRSSPVSGDPQAVHIVLQKTQGRVTVRLSTSHAVSPIESQKLQSAVNQLNQLLEQLQNP